MKLEAGKAYRTRNGKKVIIAAPIIRTGKETAGYRLEYTFLDNEGNAYMSDGTWHHMGQDKGKDLVSEWTDDDQYKADDNKTIDERSEERILEQARKYAVHINSAIDAAKAMSFSIPREYVKDWGAVNSLKCQKKLQVTDPKVKRSVILRESKYGVILQGKKVDIGCIKGIPLHILRAGLVSLTSGVQPTYGWGTANKVFVDDALQNSKARSYREGIRWHNHRLSWADADQLLAFLDQRIADENKS